MEKPNFKRKLPDTKTKITDQGDILKVEDKVRNSRINNGLYLADRGDSKKVLLRTRIVTDIEIDKCNRLEDKIPLTKLSETNEFKNATPNRKMYILSYKDTINNTREIKPRTDDNLNIKPINVRSRVNNYIQSLKLHSDKSKDARDISNVVPRGTKSRLDNSKVNVGKTGVKLNKPNEKLNLVQNDALKPSLAKTTLGCFVSREYEKCNKEVNVNKKLRHLVKPEEFVDGTIESQINEVLRFKENKDNDENNKRNTKMSDAYERKRIRERCTIRNKVSSNLNAQNDSTQENDKNQSKDKTDSKSVSTRTKDSLKKSESSRRPVITTIRSKHNAKVYKTVTFTDLNPRQTTPIEIKIPTGKRKEKSSDKHTDISGSSKEKKRKKHQKKHRKLLSPELKRKGESPPTEVAKWAPSCVNKLTIPYYEAWIDTTLAAISKSSKKDNIFGKQDLLKSFKKFLERPETPDLVYDQMDEKYTGKIKIRQRHK